MNTLEKNIIAAWLDGRQVWFRKKGSNDKWNSTASTDEVDKVHWHFDIYEYTLHPEKPSETVMTPEYRAKHYAELYEEWRSECEKKQKRVEELDKEIAHFRNLANSRLTRLENLEYLKKIQSEEINDLQGKNAELIRERDELNKRVAEYLKTNTIINNEARSLREELHTAMGGDLVSQQVEKLRNHFGIEGIGITGPTAVVEEACGLYTQLSERAQNYWALFSKEQQECIKLQDKLEGTEAELNRVKELSQRQYAEIAKLEKSIDSYAAECANSINKSNAHHSEVAKLSGSLEEEKAYSRDLLVQIGGLKGDREKLQEAERLIADLKLRLVTEGESFRELNRRLGGRCELAEAECQRLKDEMTAMKGRCLTCAHRNDGKSTSYKELEAELSKVKEALADKREFASSLHAQREALQKERDALLITKAGLLAELTDLRTKIQQVRQALENDK